MRGAPHPLTRFELEEQLRPWLLPRGLLPQYDFMISYRWSDYDSKFAERLYDCLCSSVAADGRSVDGFLDRKRLQDGDELQASFLQAMGTTRVLVPIVSARALERMARLQPGSPVDNVLLEWSYALELHAQRGVKVFPLFVGTLRDDGTMDDLFAQAPLEKVADVVVDEVARQLEAHMGRSGMAASRRRTAREVVRGLTSMLGCPVWDHTKGHGGGAESAPLWRDMGVHETVADKVREVLASVESTERSLAAIEGLAELLKAAACDEYLGAATGWCRSNGATTAHALLRCDAKLHSTFVEHLKLPLVKKALLEQEIARCAANAAAPSSASSAVRFAPSVPEAAATADPAAAATATQIGDVDVKLLRQKTSSSLRRLLLPSVLSASGKTLSSKSLKSKVSSMDDRSLAKWFQRVRRPKSAAGEGGSSRARSDSLESDDGDAELRDGLLKWLQPLRLPSKVLGAAMECGLVWCREQGARSDELGELDDSYKANFVEALHLKPIPRTKLSRALRIDEALIALIALEAGGLKHSSGK